MKSITTHADNRLFKVKYSSLSLILAISNARVGSSTSLLVPLPSLLFFSCHFIFIAGFMAILLYDGEIEMFV